MKEKQNFNKTKILQIRLTEKDKEKLEVIKNYLDISASDFLRSVIDSEYKIILEEKE